MSKWIWWGLLENPGPEVSGATEIRRKRHRNRVGIRGLPTSRGNSNHLSQLMVFIYYFLLPCTCRGYIDILLQTFWKQDMLGQSFLSTWSKHKCCSPPRPSFVVCFKPSMASPKNPPRLQSWECQSWWFSISNISASAILFSRCPSLMLF